MWVVSSLILSDAACLPFYLDTHFEIQLETGLEASLQTFPEFRLDCTFAHIACDCVEKTEALYDVSTTKFRSILLLLGWKTSSQI
jgi:hypothetical protein